jgi:hypothetical protein
MLNSLKYPLLCLMIPAAIACKSGNDDEKTISSTHPALEKQLEKDSLTTPVYDANKADLYQRYRITMEEYETDGKYRVTSIYKGNMPKLDDASHPDAGPFRTALHSSMSEGINFAGKYTVLTIDCGSNCQQHFIVDRESGKITDRIQSSIGAKYSLNSRIFIVNPPDSTIDYSNCNYCTPQAYVLENNKLRKLSYENEKQD